MPGSSNAGAAGACATPAPRVQHTLARAVRCSGVGLHTGRRVAMTIRPGAENAGIVFRRVDRAGGGAEVRALWENTIDLPMCQSLVAANGARVRTVEHLMAAFYARSIDNAVVELDAEELPILDGSASPFVELLDAAGSCPQDAPRHFIQITETVVVEAFERRMVLAPADALELDLTLAVKHFDGQRWNGPVEPRVLAEEISPARAFGSLKLTTIAAALANRVIGYPLMRGARLDNVVAIYGPWILNRGGLRMPDELVRHRIVDIVGDLYLAGGPILGRLTMTGAGHRPIRALLFAVFAQAGAWRRVTRLTP